MSWFAIIVSWTWNWLDYDSEKKAWEFIISPCIFGMIFGHLFDCTVCINVSFQSNSEATKQAIMDHERPQLMVNPWDCLHSLFKLSLFSFFIFIILEFYIEDRWNKDLFYIFVKGLNFLYIYNSWLCTQQFAFWPFVFR